MNNTEAKKERAFLAGVFLLALALRLLFDLFLKKNYFFYNHPSSDVTYYQDWARDIIRGDQSRHLVFWGLPLYPYFLEIGRASC